MSAWLSLCAALAVILLMGHALVTLLARTTALYWFERWSVAFLLGTGALSVAWFAMSPLYDAILPIWLLSLVSVATGIVAYVRRTKHHAAPSAAPEMNWQELLFAGILALEFLVLVLGARHTSLGWDGLFNFEMKARLAFEYQPTGRLPLEYFADASRRWSHPRYPLMLPFTEFWAYSWLGHVDQSAIKLLFPLFYFSLVGMLCGAVRRMTHRRIALMAGVSLGLLPTFMVQSGAISGYADVPLAAAAVGAASFAFIALRTGNTEAFTLAAALSTVAVWTKAEGLILAGTLGVATLLAALSRRRFAAVMLWMPMMVAVPWLIFQQRYGMPEADFLQPSAATLMENLHRLPTIAGLVGRELLRPGHWGMIWPACGAALVLMIWFGRSDEADWMLAGAVVAPLVLYTLVFLFSGWADVAEHVGFSIPRLLIPLAPTALLFTIVRLAGALEAERT